MSETPERHPDIPVGAVWVEEMEKWQEGSANGTESKEGECRFFRPDGSLYMRCRFRGGLQEGPFVLYHPNGQLAREGNYRSGEVHGPVTAYASDAPTPELLRGCCVPEGAWQMRAEYDNGRLLSERFFDRQGRALLSDGSLRPEPPAGLPGDVDYDEYSHRWTLAPAGGSETGMWCYFTETGRLEEEVEYVEGQRTRARLFGREGGIREETGFDSEGKAHGAHLRRFVEGVESPYLDARIAEERGAYEHGHPVGLWEFRGSDGALVRTVDRGRAFGSEAELAGPVFTDEEERPAEGWAALAETRISEGRAREAICAAARAAARRGEPDDLVAFLARHTVALSSAPAATSARDAIEGSETGAATLLSALVGGGEPAALLRALAGVLKGAPRAAHAFADAAILLEPNRAMAYLTRALVRLELGDPRGALADAARVAVESAQTAEFVRDYTRLLFPEWGFWPARERLEGTFEGIPDGPTQPLEAIRRNIQVYATRLAGLRVACRRWLGPGSTPAWLPPELPQLLPDGPIELRRYVASITDETEAGPETVEVEIVEPLDMKEIDLQETSLPAIMRMARAQWAALAWLCWVTGLDRVALPERVSPPAAFPLATGLAITRFFRVQDVMATSGLRSLSAGVPGFLWEDMDIDAMPKHFVQIAMDEYHELRALFLWLASPENLSPFQSDLRQV
jgi:antitoxin component YwqK of YwqJK toxin-antitoxin module